MEEKLDRIILITSRIYDLYIDIIECKQSKEKKEFELKQLVEYLKICLEVEKNFYDNLILTKEDFSRMIRMLNIDNNAKLLFCYENNGFVQTNLPLEIDYIYNYLFFNDNEEIGKIVNYNTLISKTSNHPIIKRIIFNLFVNFYKSKYYEPFIFNNFLKYINLNYCMEIGNILISKDNINFMEELYMEASTEFTIRVLNNLRLKVDNDEELYTYMKYLLAFTNPKIEQSLLKDDTFEKLELKEKKYNSGTTSIYNYYIFAIAQDTLNIMLYQLFQDNIPSDIREFIFDFNEALFEESFEFFEDDTQNDFIEDLKQTRDITLDDEYVKFIEKLLKKKEYTYKKCYNKKEGEDNV